MMSQVDGVSDRRLFSLNSGHDDGEEVDKGPDLSRQIASRQIDDMDGGSFHDIVCQPAPATAASSKDSALLMFRWPDSFLENVCPFCANCQSRLSPVMGSR